MSRRSRRQRDSAISLFAFQDIIAAVTGVTLIITLLLVLLLIEREPEAPNELRPVQTAAAGTADLRETRDELARQVRQLERRTQAAAQTRSPTPTELMRGEERIAQYRDVLPRLEAEVARHRERTRELLDQARELQAKRREREEALAEAEKRLEEARSPRVTLLAGERHDQTPLFLEISEDELRVGRIDDDRRPRQLRAFAAGAVEQQCLAWAQQRDPSQVYFVLLVHGEVVERFYRLRSQIESMGFKVGWDLQKPGERLFDSAGEGQTP
ncbi:MAG: hypothetical protein ACLFVN_09125 [Phycisphaeraceae bacterium]